MRLKSSLVAPSAPIFTVEVIGPDGFAWLCGPLYLNEALKISEYFEPDATPGKEPHIYVPPAAGRHGAED